MASFLSEHQLGGLDIDLLAVPSIPGSMNLPTVPRPKLLFDSEDQPQQSSQPIARVGQRRSDTTESTSSTPITSCPITSTNARVAPVSLVLPDSQVTEDTVIPILPVITRHEAPSLSERVPTVTASSAVPGAASVGWGGVTEHTGSQGAVADKFDPLKRMVEAFVDCIDIYETAGAGSNEYDALRERLEGLFEDLVLLFRENSPLAITPCMQSLCESILKELGDIQSRRETSMGVRYLTAKGDADTILACYQRIEDYLQRLSLNANQSMWRIPTHGEGGSRFSAIDLLPRSLSTRFDSPEGAKLMRRGCTPNTRMYALTHILDWARSADEPVLWLNGLAGTGKTTISYTACTELATAHKLAASFFCSHLLPEGQQMGLLIPSIAYQLAEISLQFRDVLSAALFQDPNWEQNLPHVQFETLIVEPLGKINDALLQGLVVAIDAFDEYEDEENLGRLLNTLLDKAPDLPIKFLLSSRPGPVIQDQMSRTQAKSQLVLHELDEGKVKADIETYIRAELAPMKPSERHITGLLGRAGVFFLYAAAAVRYIGYKNFQSNPNGRVDTILKGPRLPRGTENEEIDQLYTRVFEISLRRQRLNTAGQEDMKQVLFTVICARERLTIGGLSDLLKIERNGVRAALRQLSSVLYITGANELVTTLHTSLPEFMFDSDRSKGYYCDSDAHHHCLAEHCFERIARAEPQFNVCKLESSYLLDEQIPNIKERIARTIPLGLFYACRYLIDHVKAGNRTSSSVEQLRDFLSTRFLLWMEVMNLYKEIRAGRECMGQVVEWCNQLEGEHELAELAKDARRFLDTFASNAISNSTPHIYVSMLAFWPKSRPITKCYAEHIKGPIEPEGTALDRSELASSTWMFTQAIRDIAPSPDGSSIAVAMGWDVLLINSSTGTIVLGPLQGHTESVSSIAFSPDGNRVVSGSFDGTIRVWNVRNGGMVLGPLKGHTRLVRGVKVSPDGGRIASTSNDGTLRLWDIKNGKSAATIMQGGWASAPAFSHGGTLLASGSYDKPYTVHVWDSNTKKKATEPFSGHSAPITSVAFSPDDTRIISGSWDQTIRGWDIQSGNLVLGPIEGHTLWITSVGYSPDGRYIVSGSYDRTVRVWDAQSGRMMVNPLEEHTGLVTAVAFSPDGTRIISGCKDGLVCTWEHENHAPTPNIIDTCPGVGNFVQFSSNGTHLVSRCKDSTTCLWNNDDEAETADHLQTHISSAEDIGFLFDYIISSSLDGTVCIRNAQSGKLLIGPLQTRAEGELRVVAYSPSAKLIVTGSSVGVVGIWNAQTGGQVIDPFKGYDGAISSIHISPGGALIASSSHQSNIILIWDAHSGKVALGPLRGHSAPVYCVSFSSNGARIASGSADNSILVWDVFTGIVAHGPLLGHSAPVSSVNFSPDNTRIVSGSVDTMIGVWDTQTGVLMFRLLQGPFGAIQSVAYSLDGTRILSSSSDMSLRVYDARSTQEIVSTTNLYPPTGPFS